LYELLEVIFILQKIMIYFADEELGSKKGMALFVETPEFAKLNVGFGLDEAGACPTEHFLVFNAERALWRTSTL